MEKECLGNQDITLFVKGLHGPHDGIWDNGLFWVTETDGSTITAIDQNGKVKLRKKVKEDEREKISYKSFRELFRSKVKEIFLTRPGKKITHWTRGLSVTSNYMYV
ncbi:hypothetical protein KA005_43090, partial [bacterium]|nr:hypothetical protein [bacterium]